MSHRPTGMRPPRLVAKLVGDALFVDMGSTTTDIIAVRDGAVAERRLHRCRAAADGRTGLYRLHQDIPVRRGFVGAGARQADAADERVFRLDRRRAPDPGRARREGRQAPCRRRQGKDRRRLDGAAGAHGRARRRRPDAARMARRGALVQRTAAAKDARRGVPGCGQASATDAPVVGAGTGRWQIRRLAARMERRFVDFADIIPADDAVRSEASNAAPAAAVALLASMPAERAIGRVTLQRNGSKPARVTLEALRSVSEEWPWHSRILALTLWIGTGSAVPAIAQDDGQTAFNNNCRTCHTMKTRRQPASARALPASSAARPDRCPATPIRHR